jgi:glycosyltransferase involved in cell wall biosynthesis
VSAVHVAVDAHDLVRDDRGIGRYVRAVLSRALHAEGMRFTLVVRELFPPRRAIAHVVGDGEVRVGNRVPRDSDVVWSPWNGTFLDSNATHVATIHDVVPFAFPAAAESSRRSQQEPFLRTAACAHRIIVDSSFTGDEIVRHLAVDRERLVVVPLGVDEIFTAEGPAFRLSDGRLYVLHVGAHEERKNTETLIAAWERAFPAREVALVFTRRPAALPDGAVVQSAADDGALAALYRGAAVVAVPSLYEGFGLPLLEALACGVPVVASRTASLPEVGGDAALWIDEPRDVASWAHLLRAALEDEVRARARREGPSRASLFSWDRCTAQTLAVLRTAANR